MREKSTEDKRKINKLILAIAILVIFINFILIATYILTESPIQINFNEYNNYECPKNETPSLDCEIIPLENSTFKVNCTEVLNG